MDKDGVALDMSSFGSVYIKYSSTGGEVLLLPVVYWPRHGAFMPFQPPDSHPPQRIALPRHRSFVSHFHPERHYSERLLPCPHGSC